MANPAVTIDFSNHDLNGYSKLTFTNANKGVNWYSWRVKRRLNGTSAWTLLKEYFVDSASYEFHDTTVPENLSVNYSVTRVFLSGSTPTEEADTPQTGTAAGTFYWLIHATDETKNTVLRNVTADAFVDDYDFVNFRLIGRGRKSDQGTKFGVEGNLSAQLRNTTLADAAVILSRVRALKDAQVALYLKTPFGNVWKISMGELNITRVPGVGLQEFTDISFEYSEIA